MNSTRKRKLADDGYESDDGDFTPPPTKKPRTRPLTSTERTQQKHEAKDELQNDINTLCASTSNLPSLFNALQFIRRVTSAKPTDAFTLICNYYSSGNFQSDIKPSKTEQQNLKKSEIVKIIKSKLSPSLLYLFGECINPKYEYGKIYVEKEHFKYLFMIYFLKDILKQNENSLSVHRQVFENLIEKIIKMKPKIYEWSCKEDGNSHDERSRVMSLPSLPSSDSSSSSSSSSNLNSFGSSSMSTSTTTASLSEVKMPNTNALSSSASANQGLSVSSNQSPIFLPSLPPLLGMSLFNSSASFSPPTSSTTYLSELKLPDETDELLDQSVLVTGSAHNFFDQDQNSNSNSDSALSSASASRPFSPSRFWND